jgi:hypothetical protein
VIDRTFLGARASEADDDWHLGSPLSSKLTGLGAVSSR